MQPASKLSGSPRGMIDERTSKRFHCRPSRLWTNCASMGPSHGLCSAPRARRAVSSDRGVTDVIRNMGRKPRNSLPQDPGTTLLEAGTHPRQVPHLENAFIGVVDDRSVDINPHPFPGLICFQDRSRQLPSGMEAPPHALHRLNEEILYDQLWLRANGCGCAVHGIITVRCGCVRGRWNNRMVE